MRFEHLVQINDPLHPLIEPLTRAQVWQGLLLRAEQPQIFMAQLIGARIVVRDECYLVRELNFGAFSVRDRVRLELMQRMMIETEAAHDRGIGILKVSIEAPDPEQLQLRFEYELRRTYRDTPEQEALYDRLVEAAYLEADLDCVRIIRQRAVEGI